MRRNTTSQVRRSQDDPLILGTFSQTSLRYLTGSFGPKYRPIGKADTGQIANGGIGGGTYNNWFQINITSPAWIIIAKGPPRPKYVQVSAYNLNKIPLTSKGIFDADSISTGNYYPYLGQVISAGSDLYNNYERLRLDRGDDQYFPLEAGSYLICVSSTRNEPLDYSLGIIIEFPETEGLFALEDNDGSILSQETSVNSAEVESPVTTSISIPLDAFTEEECIINPGVTVTVEAAAEWLIGDRIPEADLALFGVLLEPGDPAYFQTIHDHSLSEWKAAWDREHQQDDRFPELFVGLTNRG